MISLEDLAFSILTKNPLVPKVSGYSDQDLYNTIVSTGMTDLELTVVLEELLINAREHGKQNVEIYAGKHLGDFYFAISDQGLGIHNTLPNNPHLSDTRNKAAAALIRLACEEGITGTGVIGRGVGLHLLSAFCFKRNAECLLLSDGGYVLQVHDRFLEKPHTPSIEGTLVCLKVSYDHH